MQIKTYLLQTTLVLALCDVATGEPPAFLHLEPADGELVTADADDNGDCVSTDRGLYPQSVRDQLRGQESGRVSAALASRVSV